jgi:DnaJ family protein A protein 2
MNKNLYDILEISSDASFEEIKSKYKSLAQQHHPEKGGDPEFFKSIKNAYEILINPVSRERYDTTGQFENLPNIHEQALNRLSQLFFTLVPNINADVDDLIQIMRNESYREKHNINNNINICNGYIFKLKKVTSKIQKTNQGSENLLKMFAETQLKRHENELQNFTHQIEIVNLVIKMLDEYHYGDVSVLMESLSNNPTENN